MRTFFFLPPLRQASGGVAVIRRMAAMLAASGREVFFVPYAAADARNVPSEPCADVPIVPWPDLALAPADLWVVPEGWVNALAPGLQAGARCLVYVQNWAYLLSCLPTGASWRRLPVEFLAVSDPVARFVAATTGRTAEILRPGVDGTLFRPPKGGKDATHGLRIAFMPRKNKALAQQIRETFAALDGKLAARCRWVEIAGMNAAEVAAALGAAHIFLATGFPEGCPLPPLEAMACGCLTVGYMGFGGADYMRQALPPAEDPAAFAPWWPLRGVDWGGNGFWSADADVPGAALHLTCAARWWLAADARLAPTLENARATARAYSLETQRRNVLNLWTRLEAA